MKEAQATRGERVLIVTPARNEAHFLPRVIESIVGQSQRPACWVIVDDGSTDETFAIAERAAREHDWIRVLRRRDRGQRVLGSGVIHAFEYGRSWYEGDYDYVAKMDADVTVGPRYLETAMKKFADDPELGALSGKVYREDSDGRVEEFMIDDMVAGQWKLYRRETFEDIGGFVPRVMWDGIDFHQARRCGWKTRSFEDADLAILHHRLMGSSERNVLVGRLRWGRGQWFLGSHPLYVAASALWRMREKPRFLGGLLIFAGFLGAWLRGDERYGSRAFRRDLHTWQWNRLLGLTRGVVR